MATTLHFSIILIFAEISSGMKGFLRIGYFSGPDAVMEKQDVNNVTFVTGYFLDLVKWMSADGKFNYCMVKIENLESFATITKEMSLKDIDFALPSYAVSSERKSLATFLYPTQIAEYTLILPYPKRESDPWSCLKPFAFSVWLCIAVCVLVIPFLMKITASVEVADRNTFSTPHSTLWADASVYVLGVITNQGGYYLSKSRTSRFIAAIWCLGAVVLVNAYSSLLITYLTAPKLSLLVHSIGELAERDDIQVLVEKGSFIRRQLESAEGSLKPIRANMERIPDDYCGSVWESKREYCLDQVKKGGSAYVSSMEQAEDEINVDFAKTKTCSLTYIQNTFSPHYAAFIAPVNVSHDLRNSLDVSILRAISYGLIEKFQSFYYTKNESPCTRYRSQDQQLKKLSVVDFTSAFILLTIGCSLSLIALAYELATRRLQKPQLSR